MVIWFNRRENSYRDFLEYREREREREPREEREREGGERERRERRRAGEIPRSFPLPPSLSLFSSLALSPIPTPLAVSIPRSSPSSCVFLPCLFSSRASLSLSPLFFSSSSASFSALLFCDSLPFCFWSRLISPPASPLSLSLALSLCFPLSSLSLLSPLFIVSLSRPIIPCLVLEG